MVDRFAFLVMLLASSCRSVVPDPGAQASASAPPATAIPPPAPVPPPELRVIACGFGGVGPVGPPSAPDAWIVVVVEVTSPSAPRAGLRADGVVLLDAAGTAVAHAQGSIDARVAPPGWRTGDFSSYGTSPFAGDLAKDAPALLRLHGPLDARLAALWKTPSLRARVTIAGADGVRVTAESAACSTWPTG